MNTHQTKINILSDDLVAKIAAGEVVERPASVVKELVENSIDSGATSIEIEVQEGGSSLIRVADNGIGMTASDARLACHQHATSKIKCADDLERISTLGFRGEALSSIAAVSQLEITSSTGDEGGGIYLHLESGEVLKEKPAGRARGTTVEVRSLFYNVPARRKFLKKESTELAEIVAGVGRFILSYPGIEFKLAQGKRTLLHAAGNMTIQERIKLVLGVDAAEDMVELAQIYGKYSISGFTSRPSITRKDREAQVFFVNGRFVRSKALSDALYVAYRSLLERGRYPQAVIFLKTSLDAVDVNVHPTKMQVKFDDEHSVKDAVRYAIQDSFASIKRDEPLSLVFSGDHKPEAFTRTVFQGACAAETQAEFGYTPGVYKETHLVDGLVAEDIFQISNSYIVKIGEDRVVITDQHAAHERVLYEFFTKSMETGAVEVQNLLFPAQLDLAANEASIMCNLAGSLKKLGFTIEPFGEKSFVVHAYPAVLKDRDIKKVVSDIVADFASREETGKIDSLDELIKMTSCRAAIKAGDVLRKEEVTSLLNQLASCDLPFTCPHGRPTTLEITVDELEKRFRRK